MSKQFAALVLGLILAAIYVPLAAQTYSFQSFSYPNATPTFAYGINNRGAVVGYVAYPGKTTYTTPVVDFGFKRDANGVLERPFAAASKPNSTVARGINDHGVIVGQNSGGNHFSTGFLLYHGVFTYYNAPPCLDTYIYGINNQGDFVGEAIGWGCGQRWQHYGFVNSKGVVTKIKCPTKLSHTLPYGIAADGTIVGSCSHHRATVGFIRGPAGQYQLLQVPGADSTRFNAINNVAHQIVGYYTTQGKTHGVVYDYLTGAVTTVDWPDPNTQHTYVTGINSQGVIVGYAMVQDAQGQDLPVFSFIGTPQ